MARVLGLVALVAGIPVMVFACTLVASTGLELRQAGAVARMGRLAPTIPSTSPSGPPLAEVCSGTQAGRPEICTEYMAVRMVGRIALGSAAVGVVWLACIGLAGLVARRSRWLLLVAFSVGLPITNLLLIVLVAVNGLLVAAGLYALVLAGAPVPGFVVIAVGLAALVGVLGLVSASLGTVKWSSIEVMGVGLTKESQPALWGTVDKLAVDLNIEAPRHVIVGLDPGFFVTEAPVQCLNGRSSGRVLYLSLPFCRVLRPSELAFVVGHELGHFRGNDLWFTRRFYPIFQGTRRSLEGLAMAAGGLIQTLPLYPALAIMHYFYDAFSEAEATLSRDRELAADRVGVEAADAVAGASTLAKLTAFDRHWDHALTLFRRQARVARAEPYNVCASFADLVRKRGPETTLDAEKERHLSHPTNSHPPLGVRLAALGADLDAVSAMLQDAAPERSAVESIAQHEAIELELSEALFASVAGR